MNTTFNHLPLELQEMIYKKKHQLEMQDVLQECIDNHNKNKYEVNIYILIKEVDRPNSRYHYVRKWIEPSMNVEISNKIQSLVKRLSLAKAYELKNECKINQLKVSGNKRELIQRLIKLP